MPDNIRFDIERDRRIGLPEAVFCAGKPRDALLTLLERFADPAEKPILFTRLEPAVWADVPEGLRALYSYDPLSRTAWHRTCPSTPSGTVAVVSAGTADGFVTHEAARTLEYLGRRVRLFEDCGVAGLWRIQKALPEINACDVVIVAAGLDAALASVLGGLTPKPVFAVPTSVGYGVAEHGITALRSMLASCAPGVAVLNIDNGYGAACAAARVLALMDSLR
ncbi:MAG: nickel pincer cofactor biosynthesis protein LarB [Sutterella sp.]|nr:nickel pincer cofactor biosynthesis protein LarB [Sutterella sp.]